jgi:HlyD family secretion protein
MSRFWNVVNKSVTILALLAAFVGIYWFGPWHQTEVIPIYRTEKIATGNIAKTVAANGTLNPVVLVNVGTQISGVINKLNVDFNDRVQKGQVLAEINPSLINAQMQQDQAALASAQASLKLAQANQRRSKELYAQDYIARMELDQSVQALEAAKAQVNSALGLLKRDHTNLGYTVIASPVSGVVVSRNVDIGQTVAANFQTPILFTIAQDLQKMQIDTSVAEADVGGIRIGQAVNFTVDAYPERVFQGKVRRVRLDSKVLQNVVTYDVVIDVDNPEEILLPGMTAFVNIVIEERNECLKLPLAALKFRPRNDMVKKPGNTVYRLDNNQAVAIGVQIGISDGKFAELIGGGLKEGDSVIVEDQGEYKSENKDAAGAQSNFRVRTF